ncbi:replication initiation protein [Cytobacillus sp. IB215665]|uniref:replication initiation protein n=1 Tax=Cytobacillus sp. IB215665 TaxID=3097357 RepID=UPI002A168F80|nr:replication initiation protein [Cytobacillus sp. IB215665]MDX8367208.1 replication initiation protein [Cytobacillus sp. IB215665]
MVDAEAIQEEQLTFDADLVEADIKPYYWVNQSNALINMRQNLSINERRLLYALVSLVQPEHKDFKTYTLQTKELAHLFGISETGFYERIREVVQGLNNKPLSIQRTENNKLVIDDIYWVQRASYKEGQIKIKLSEDLAQFLLNLKSYTKYQLYNVLQLRSEYSWRIYELLKEREPWHQRIIKVKELRNLLGIPDDKLKLMKNFRSVVLEKAKKEISEKTDIRFEYEVHKKIGRTIDSFIFYIYKNTNNIETNLSEEAIDYDIQLMLSRLVSNGVRREKAVEIIKKYHPKYIEDNLRYVMRMDNKALGNVAGYIVKAIENNYADVSYEVESNDNPLYKLAIGNVASRIKELTSKDIKELEELYDHFIMMIQKVNPETKADIDELVRERERVLFNKFDSINQYRIDNRLPPISESDLEKTKVIQLYKKWYENHIDEMPF